MYFLCFTFLCVTVINSTGVALQHVNNTLEQLRPKVVELNVNISAVRQRINVTLSLPGCVNCTSLQPKLDKLSLDADLEVSQSRPLMRTSKCEAHWGIL